MSQDTLPGVFKTQVQSSFQRPRSYVGCQIIQGDALTSLQSFPDTFFQCCITSPPYWGLRDYEIDGQIGAESSLQDYVLRLRNVFREVHRTLKNDGTLWLNIGDAYTSGNRTWRDSDKKNPARAMDYRPPTPQGLKPKDLIGIPWRIAFALQEDGWYLRSDIIWYKPNCQPESVKDRPTRSHEYLFMFSKSEKYFYNYMASREPSVGNGNGKNRRSVWSISTEPFPEAHFATFPISLVIPCLECATRPDDIALDPFFGSGTLGVACLKTQRKFVGIELKPAYVRLAKSRVNWPD